MKTVNIGLAGLGLVFCWQAESHAYGFDDSGLLSAGVKTSYAALNEGTSDNKLTIINPCLWSSVVAFNGCPSSPDVYSNSNAWWDKIYAFATAGYWVLDLNNEPAFSNVNPGPPHVSLPRSEPGHGIMGFSTLKESLVGEDFYRAHLVLNQTFTNPHGDAGIPFLSIGADSRAGNSSDVGAINPTSGVPHKVTFTARVWDFKAPECNTCQYAVATHRLWATSEWNGVPRMLFLNLFHWNIEARTEDPPGSGTTVPGQNVQWNWPIDEHYLHPGADIAFIDAEDTYSVCGFWVKRLKNIGDEHTYTINLHALFHCMATAGYFTDPIPATSNIPITGVHWVNENSGVNGWLWTSVHNMQMIN